MAEPYLGHIKMFAGNFAPRGYALCDGQILPINQNQSLYSLLGTTYGGDGRTSFALPDLRGRSPMHEGTTPGGTNHPLGQKGGAEYVTLTESQIPSHSHTGNIDVATAPGEESSPQETYLASKSQHYAEESTSGAFLAGSSSLNAGGGQAHYNRQPFLAINFIIALQGLFPSRN